MNQLRRRVLMLAPAGVVALGGAAFWAMLSRMRTGQFDPHAIGEPMLGKPIPDFALPPTANGQGFTANELRQAAAKQPILLNFFASWCIPCASEADTLAEVSKHLPIWGIAYKDAPEKTAAFLTEYGNPYTRTAADAGSTFINFGCYGVPESFLIGRDGRIAWHIGGPLSDDVVRDKLDPAMKAAA
jgi:cytochrome c biogenesis protein CcmG/thiol:disulfide interchange protein DsbE